MYIGCDAYTLMYEKKYNLYRCLHRVNIYLNKCASLNVKMMETYGLTSFMQFCSMETCPFPYLRNK